MMENRDRSIIMISEYFKAAYPEVLIGLLVMTDVVNSPYHENLERRKAEVETEIRERYANFDRARFKALPTIQAYSDYYKKFDKSYHVLLQLESVALKGKSIPSVAALVEAMFMAELKNMLLTAGHDLDKLELPLTLGISSGGENFIGISGREETLRPGDMFIADCAGIISSVIYGPDARTCISSDTKTALFNVYAPAGIREEDVEAHLADIEDYVRLVAPEARTLARTVLK